MVTWSVTTGRFDVSAMTCGPGPGMLNVIVSRPRRALALPIAWRSEPGPLSLVVVTANGPAPAAVLVIVDISSTFTDARWNWLATTRSGLPSLVTSTAMIPRGVL